MLEAKHIDNVWNVILFHTYCRQKFFYKTECVIQCFCDNTLKQQLKNVTAHSSEVIASLSSVYYVKYFSLIN